MIASSRRLSLLTIATLFAVSLPGAGQAQSKGFEYAASTGQYRFATDNKGSQTVNGQTMEGTTSVSRLMTIALTRTAPDTVTMVLTVDSMTQSSNAGMPTMGIEKVPGTKISAKLAPNGSFYSVVGPTAAENPVVAGMTDELGRALPRIKPVLANGLAWTDSLKDKINQRGIELNRDVVTKYTVSGDSVVGGESAWRILRETVAKAAGAGLMMGQQVSLETSGSGKGVLWVSKKGVLMGGRSEETGTGTANFASGMAVAFSNATTSVFTKVK